MAGCTSSQDGGKATLMNHAMVSCLEMVVCTVVNVIYCT